MAQIAQMIIPAAGYGSRMGYPLAKEMLPDPSGKLLIDYWLDLALERQWPVHVVTRPEKTNLRSHIFERQKLQEISLQLVDPTKEWPDTVLASAPYWRNENVLALPDTHFAPFEALDRLASSLEEAEAVYGTIESYEARSFGGFHLEADHFSIFEKCAPSDRHRIWGLIAFRKEWGAEIFEAHLDSTLRRVPRTIAATCREVPLSHFVDLTRTEPSRAHPNT